MKCFICGSKNIKGNCQYINGNYYHNYCIENLAKINKEVEKENFNLRENIYIEKMSFPSNERNIKELIEMPTYEDLLNQQKEFIEYLENEIESCELTTDLIFNHNKEMKIYKEILSKYKEIIGENNG